VSTKTGAQHGNKRNGLLQTTVASAQGAEKKKRRGAVVTDMAHA